jgi:hypothetical protein
MAPVQQSFIRRDERRTVQQRRSNDEAVSRSSCKPVSSSVRSAMAPSSGSSIAPAASTASRHSGTGIGRSRRRQV